MKTLLICSGIVQESQQVHPIDLGGACGARYATSASPHEL